LSSDLEGRALADDGRKHIPLALTYDGWNDLLPLLAPWEQEALRFAFRRSGRLTSNS